jgi:hypothetical protein
LCPPQGDTNVVTYKINAKDLCGNWASQFMVTFLATGQCKPFCTVPQTTWGDLQGAIDGMATPVAIEKLINQYGGLTAGKLGKSITVTSVDCIQSMLPGAGTTAQFNPGNYDFATANDCLPPSPVLNSDGTMKNQLAADGMALQLNMWYNLKFNGRNLGVQQLAKLPPCMVDPVVLDKLAPGQATVQGLLNLSNNYLDGTGFFPPNFGNLLDNALQNLNGYWLNCTLNDPCPFHLRDGASNGDNLSNVNLAPNPATDLVTISFEAAAGTELLVRFIGSSGVQFESSIQVVTGYNALSFSTKTFPAGIYTVILQDDQSRQTLRMVKIMN